MEVRAHFGTAILALGLVAVAPQVAPLLTDRYDETLLAYWSDDGSNPARENRLFAQFSRASFDLENHLSKINIIRAIYAIFGTVY